MNRISLLPGLVLVLAVGIAHAQEPLTDPLANKTFRSIEKLPCGDRRDGTVNLIHWQVRFFKDGTYSWLHYDKIVTGSYSFDVKSGTITIKGGPEASCDANRHPKLGQTEVCFRGEREVRTVSFGARSSVPLYRLSTQPGSFGRSISMPLGVTPSPPAQM